MACGSCKPRNARLVGNDPKLGGNKGGFFPEIFRELVVPCQQHLGFGLPTLRTVRRYISRLLSPQLVLLCYAALGKEITQQLQVAASLNLSSHNGQALPSRSSHTANPSAWEQPIPCSPKDRLPFLYFLHHVTSPVRSSLTLQV